ncbi:MAG: hypothetical protein M3527_03485 [Actinomycetota bacterium]|nr:flavodoxin family protein [Acidimicrobiia bacterium]MDQ3293498.1 hypothetical protein [Actinomycetota bacterium]
MRAVVIYESLTGNTRKVADLVAAGLTEAGHPTVACPVTMIDYAALHEAELVVVGGWTDGLFFVAQRPGRLGRLKKIPAIAGKRALCYATYALDAGRVLEKLIAVVESKGAVVEGGMTIRRDRLEQGAADLVDRVLANVVSA